MQLPMGKLLSDNLTLSSNLRAKRLWGAELSYPALLDSCIRGPVPFGPYQRMSIVTQQRQRCIVTTSGRSIERKGNTVLLGAIASPERRTTRIDLWLNASTTDFGTDKERGIGHYISDSVDLFLRYRSGTPHIQSAWLMFLPHVKNYCFLLFPGPRPTKGRTPPILYANATAG